MDEDIKKDLIAYFRHIDHLKETSQDATYYQEEKLMIENRLRKAVGVAITC